MKISHLSKLLILTAACLCRALGASSPDKPQSFGGLDDTLLLIRRQELQIEAVVQRLKIDVQAAEKSWHADRETETEIRLGQDSIGTLPLRATVLWEQLSTYRTDLENLEARKTFLARQRAIFRGIIEARKKSGEAPELWHDVLDSIRALRSRVADACRLREERLEETRFELAALSSPTASIEPGHAAQRLTDMRKFYLRSRISSDSAFPAHGMRLDTVLATYQIESRAQLKQFTLLQRASGLSRRITGIWSYQVSNVDGKPLTAGKIIIALFVIIAGLKIAQILSKTVSRFIARKFAIESGALDATQKLSFYAFSVIFTLYALHTVQVPLTAFTIMGGALALGVGLGSQNILNNFISGIILLMERPMKAGDFLEIDSVMGTVESIGLRSTRIRTPGNVHMVIPNSSFLEKNIINWTLVDRLVRIEMQVGVQYGSDVRRVKALLLEAAGLVEEILKQSEPIILFSDFGDSALIFDVLFWVRIRNVVDRRIIVSNLRFKVDDLFRKAGVVIAFPQRDVHVDTASPLRVRIET